MSEGLALPLRPREHMLESLVLDVQAAQVLRMTARPEDALLADALAWLRTLVGDQGHWFPNYAARQKFAAVLLAEREEREQRIAELEAGGETA